MTHANSDSHPLKNNREILEPNVDMRTKKMYIKLKTRLGDQVIEKVKKGPYITEQWPTVATYTDDTYDKKN